MKFRYGNQSLYASLKINVCILPESTLFAS